MPALTRADSYRRVMQGNKIRNKAGRIVPCTFTESQNIMWRQVAPELDSRGRLWFIVLKSRQVMATTFFMNLTFTRTTEQPNTNSLIIAQDLDSSTEIFNMAKRFYDHLPLPKMKPSKIKELIFPFDGGASKFKVVSAGTASKGRGTTQTCVHCSEVAFWPHPEVLTGLFQAMPDLGDTLWVLESTANGIAGQGEMFYKEWKSAMAGRSKLVPIFIPWFVMKEYREGPPVDPSEYDEEEKILASQFTKFGLDGYSLRWRRNAIETKCQGLLEMFHQEYPSTAEEAFISSGFPAFDPLAILRQQEHVRPCLMRMSLDDDEIAEDTTGEMHVWKAPKEGHQYAIGVDTSEGYRDPNGEASGDYSCGQIIDMDDLEQVAVIHGSLQPYEFSKLLDRAGRWYNNAIINIEVKSAGWAVQDYMMRLFQYPRFHPWKGKPDRINQTVRLWGWDTNVYSRPLLIEAGRRAINKGLITIHDANTLDEIKHFSRNDDGKYEAEAGHDDRVLALLLALRTREENYFVGRTAYTVGLSEPDSYGVRTMDEPSEKVSLRRIHRALQSRVDQSVRTWMES